MKRILSAFVSLSLLLSVPAPAAWSAAALVASGPGASMTRAHLRSPAAGGLALPLNPRGSDRAIPGASLDIPAFIGVQSPESGAEAVEAANVDVRSAGDVQGVLDETVRQLSKAPTDDAAGVIGKLYEPRSSRRDLTVGVVATPDVVASERTSLREASPRPAGGISSGGVASIPSGEPNAPQGSKIGGAVKALAFFALGAAANVGLQAAAVALAPALFAVVPAVAAWAVSGGAIFVPVALYARYRLSLQDLPRLTKIKAVMDAALGVYAGALIVALPSLAAAPVGFLLAAVPVAGIVAGLAVRGSPFMNSAAIWGSLGLAPLAVSAAAVAGGLAPALILGMMVLPVTTTIAFFLGRGGIIASAASGEPFSVPGSLQKLRFPTFPWVMTGVVFALLAGFPAVYTTQAFVAWMILGTRESLPWDKAQPFWKNLLNKLASFDTAYLGLLAFTAATGFSSPLTFLVVAFSVERASWWTERLLKLLLPRAKTASSAGPASVDDSSLLDVPGKLPQEHYWAKTVGLIAAMAGIGVIMGLTVFGFKSLLSSMIPAVLLSFLPFFFATKLIKAVMRSKPAEEASNPEFFAIMRDLRDRINAGRRAKGQAEIPMPEMVIDPLPVPNAYATGRSPSKALVGVTEAMKEMTLDPEKARAVWLRMFASVPADSEAFGVYRRAVAGSISGVSAEATPTEVQAALLKADRAELKALGVRALRGVLGHEFSHVMDRHMLSGAIAGAINAAIAFAARGVLWAVSRAEIAVQKIFDLLMGRRSGSAKGRVNLTDPVSVGAAAKSLPGLLKLLAALWVPVLVQIVQMASSRNSERMADEDGAILTEDPEALALALGMLMSWRPGANFHLPGYDLPILMALSHLMTVNPVKQVDEAGALPKLDAVTTAVVGKNDDFLFNLFITHPETMERIEKLALRARADSELSGLRSLEGYLGYSLVEGDSASAIAHMRTPHVLVRMSHPRDIVGKPEFLRRAAGLPVVYDFASQEGVVTMQATLQE